jgi:hypothetical protein
LPSSSISTPSSAVAPALRAVGVERDPLEPAQDPRVLVQRAGVRRLQAERPEHDNPDPVEVAAVSEPALGLDQRRHVVLAPASKPRIACGRRAAGVGPRPTA